MKLTARLWARSDKSWTADILEETMTAFQTMPMPRFPAKRGRRKAEARKYQATAYVAWKERCIKDWWQNKLCQTDAPNNKQREFMDRVINRCRQ
eukprot:3207086-Karenia_brevis.AAC.2